MSHITQLALDVKDLAALALACSELGLEFVQFTEETPEREKRYKCYPRPGGSGHVFPEGFSVADWGKCDMGVIRVKGAGANTYEIGVSRRRDGKSGFVLLYDYWQNGYGLIPKVGGNDAPRLKQEYGVQVALKQARRMGLRGVYRKTLPNGSVVVAGAR